MNIGILPQKTNKQKSPNQITFVVICLELTSLIHMLQVSSQLLVHLLLNVSGGQN